MSTSTPPPSLSTTAASPASSPVSGPPAAALAFDPTTPLFAIEHVARLFLLEVDTARELTYRDDFPKPIKIGRRWLWFPAEILTWAHKQQRFSVADRRRNSAPVEQAAPPPAIKAYKPRAKKSDVAA